MTIRARLTLLYTALVVVGASVLVIGVGVLTATTTSDSTTPASRAEQALGLPAGALTSNARSHRPLDVSLPLRTDLHDVATGVQAETRSDLLSKLAWFSAALLVAVALAAIAAGWIVTGHILAPLRAIGARADRLSPSALDERIPEPAGAGEIRDLARSLNGMLARLDRAFAGQRLFVANASHELKTPLTRIRTALDVTLARDEVTAEDLDTLRDVIRGSVDESAGTIDALLVLARADEDVTRLPTDLADAARLALETTEEEAAARDVSVTSEIVPAPVDADPVLIERVARNLIENAVRHNEDGGWVRVTVGASEELSSLRVSNGGADLRATDVDELFVPFHRGARTRIEAPGPVGSGLGLAIVRAIADAHGATVEASARPDGGLDVAFSMQRRA